MYPEKSRVRTSERTTADTKANGGGEGAEIPLQTMVQTRVTHRSCRDSLLRNIHNLRGYGPEKPGLADRVLSRLGQDFQEDDHSAVFEINGDLSPIDPFGNHHLNGD
ncbi:hypothetical protein TURU_113739 [Turdus rufiventris]|nr:hypothetical protein TURU_113739 [Turdus rufiventris]